jgi:hypothetical protein
MERCNACNDSSAGSHYALAFAWDVAAARPAAAAHGESSRVAPQWCTRGSTPSVDAIAHRAFDVTCRKRHQRRAYARAESAP